MLRNSEYDVFFVIQASLLLRFYYAVCYWKGLFYDTGGPRHATIDSESDGLESKVHAMMNPTAKSAIWRSLSFKDRDPNARCTVSLQDIWNKNPPLEYELNDLMRNFIDIWDATGN